jgi:hypothetical protein
VNLSSGSYPRRGSDGPFRPPALGRFGQLAVPRRSQFLALREERPDTAVTAESARRSSFALRAAGSRRSAATARRWTSSRASGSAMASSSQVRSRADRKTHMFSVPSSSRLAASPAARRLIGRLHHRLELCISGGLENFPEPAELVTETAGVKAVLAEDFGFLEEVGVEPGAGGPVSTRAVRGSRRRRSRRRAPREGTCRPRGGGRRSSCRPAGRRLARRAPRSPGDR